MKSSASHRAPNTVPGLRYYNAAVVIAAGLGFASSAFAQSASDHAAQAHGRPIVNGHSVQPTPDMVKERLRHHEQMLQAERQGSTRPSIGQPPDGQASAPGSSGASDVVGKSRKKEGD